MTQSKDSEPAFSCSIGLKSGRDEPEASSRLYTQKNEGGKLHELSMQPLELASLIP